MIEARGLTKRYGDKVAVDDLTFTVRPGVVTGFLGPNGAGKSTTMRMILGLDAPTRGSVTVNGKPYREHAAPLREVGALLEARSVHPGRSAHHHLLALAQTSGIPRSRVDDVIDAVGLRAVARRRAGGFSLGTAQRVGIATALLGDPRTVILDEPLNGLDTEGIRWVRSLLRDLAAEGRTVFVSSHLMNEMALTAEHLVVIGRGRLIADAGTQAFIAEDGALAVAGLTTDRIGTIAWAAGITLVVGVGILYSLLRAARPPADPAASGFDPTAVSLAGVGLAQIAIGVLGVLLVTGEYTTGSIPASLAAVPRRLPLLWGKAAALALATLTLCVPATFAAFIAGQSILSGEHLDTTLGAPGTARAVLGGALCLTAVALLGLGVGALLRNPAGAISALLGMLFAPQLLAGLLPSAWSDHLYKYLPSPAGLAITTVGPDPNSLAPWTGFALFCLDTAVVVTVAAWLLRRRDA